MAKSNTARNGVDPPTKEVISWAENMSEEEQRNHASAGLRVKVRFESKRKVGRATRSTKANFIWYGGVISQVFDNRRKIKIDFDDHTEELASFPDSDIIIDDVGNGTHLVDASSFIPESHKKDSCSSASRSGRGCSVPNKWSESEHSLFKQGVKLHGWSAWREIEGLIPTRTNIQIRNHALSFKRHHADEVARLVAKHEEHLRLNGAELRESSKRKRGQPNNSEQQMSRNLRTSGGLAQGSLKHPARYPLSTLQSLDSSSGVSMEVKQEEDEVKVLDFVDLSQKNKVLMASRKTGAGNGVSLHSIAATRPPFFTLYDTVMTRLSSAQQHHDDGAQEFYEHLKQWFVLKIEEDGFDVSEFDAGPIEQLVSYFDDTVQRLSTARLERRDTNMLDFELKCIIKDCKVKYPIRSTNSEAIKLEQDQYTEESEAF